MTVAFYAEECWVWGRYRWFVGGTADERVEGGSDREDHHGPGLLMSQSGKVACPQSNVGSSKASERPALGRTRSIGRRAIGIPPRLAIGG